MDKKKSRFNYESHGIVYSPVPVPWKLWGEDVEKDEEKGKRRVWGYGLFYGTRCQWKMPVPATSAARTLEAGTVTLIKW